MSLYLHDNTSLKKSQDHLEVATEKRALNIQVAAMLEGYLNSNGYKRVLECGNTITMLEDAAGTAHRYDTGFFCEHRMCPSCAWRKSMGTAVLITAITGALVEKGRVPLMVTLTAPNCEGEALGEEIKRYNSAWDKLIRRKRYREAWGDNIRKLEVTYNADADTYHPHLHVLVYVEPGYFNGRSYLSRKQLLSDWRDCFRNQNITQVDIRKTYGTDGKAIAEMSKYVAKASDFLHSQRVFDTFYAGMRGKRLIGYSGLCKELRAAYKAGELRQYIDRDTTKYAWRVMYKDLKEGYTEVWRQAYESTLEDDEGMEIASAWAYMED